MAKQLNWHLVENELRKKDVTVFSPQDLQHLLGASEIALRFLLTRAVKRGDVLKLRRGLYGLSAHTPSELEIANLLYRPSYISFTFALSYYHIIPETVYELIQTFPKGSKFKVHSPLTSTGAACMMGPSERQIF